MCAKDGPCELDTPVGGLPKTHPGLAPVSGCVWHRIAAIEKLSASAKAKYT